MYYLTTEDLRSPIIQIIIKNTFPEYNGKKVTVNVAKTFIPNQSWEGGSRQRWKIVRSDGKIFDPKDLYTSGTFNPQEAYREVEIPDNCFVVIHNIFCGKDMGLKILTKESLVLPSNNKQEISKDEIIVLVATRSLKSSYAGDYLYRFHEAKRCTGITEERWNIAVDSLIEKGLLNKNKAINARGRNILVETGNQWAQLWTLK